MTKGMNLAIRICYIVLMAIVVTILSLTMFASPGRTQGEQAEPAIGAAYQWDGVLYKCSDVDRLIDGLQRHALGEVVRYSEIGCEAMDRPYLILTEMITTVIVPQSDVVWRVNVYSATSPTRPADGTFFTFLQWPIEFETVPPAVMPALGDRAL